MKALAKELQLEAGDYDVRSQRGGPAVSGEIILHTDSCYVMLSLGLCVNRPAILTPFGADRLPKLTP
jgi:hypothetical protein